MSRKKRLLGTAGLALVALLAVAACGGSSPRSADTAPTVAQVSNPRTFPDVVAQVRSGVIRIETTACDHQEIGTGILLSPTLVATVEHVVSGGISIKLKRDGHVIGTGTIIGSDAARDVALVRSSRPISGHNFRFAARAPRVGEDVAAIGFPLALPLTVTRGSVSGLDRTIPIGGVNRKRLVQTDAAVNPGNSGGPLITDDGLVVGLVDLKADPDEASGLAFAVSADVASPLLAAWRSAPQPVSAARCSSSHATETVSASASGDAASYVNGLDRVLVQYSARARTTLGQLVDAVNGGSISEAGAANAIQAIIGNRQAFLTAIGKVTPPPAFSQAHQTLARSLQVSIADDQAIANWIDATFAGDSGSADYYWSRQQSLSLQASQLKQSFLDQYNGLRARLLGLPALDIHY
jgi:hypothetical protein